MKCNFIPSWKNSKLPEYAFWLLSVMLMLFVFSSNRYDFGVRIAVVGVLITMSFAITQLVNRFLIPKYLFKGRVILFAYFVLATIIVSIWINFLCIAFIMWYAASLANGTMLPSITDLILLLSGSYIVILFAAFTHFTRETYSRQIERDRNARLKAEAELKLQEARLKILQGQLHPHFLFNMLNNLYGLWMEKSDAAPEVILKLSSLLDYMLYKGNMERVPLQGEIDFIRNYLALESIRFDSRLVVDVDMPDDVKGMQIAPLILFIFVENAFKHGASKNIEATSIRIALEFTNKGICFIVSNTLSEAAGKEPGIGLQNVKERLCLLYPQRHNLSIVNDNTNYKVELIINL